MSLVFFVHAMYAEKLTPATTAVPPPPVAVRRWTPVLGLFSRQAVATNRRRQCSHLHRHSSHPSSRRTDSSIIQPRDGRHGVEHVDIIHYADQRFEREIETPMVVCAVEEGEIVRRSRFQLSDRRALASLGRRRVREFVASRLLSDGAIGGRRFWGIVHAAAAARYGASEEEHVLGKVGDCGCNRAAHFCLDHTRCSYVVLFSFTV